MVCQTQNKKTKQNKQKKTKQNKTTPTAMAVSCLSNSVFIYTVYCIPELRTITNAYPVNTAVADIIFVVISGRRNYVLPYMMSPLKGNVHYGQIGMHHSQFTWNHMLLHFICVTELCWSREILDNLSPSLSTNG